MKHALYFIASALYLSTAASPITPQLPFLSQLASSVPQTPSNSRLPPLSVLASTLPLDYLISLAAHVASLPEKRLLRWADGHEEWVTEGEKALLVWKEGGRRFEDVTDRPETAGKEEMLKGKTFPSDVRYGNETLQGWMRNISQDRMRKRLIKLSSFRTRYYRSSTGRDSQAWLLSQLNNLASTYPKANLTIHPFPHPWGQNSLIAHWSPSSSSSKPTIVIGAHQDSTNLLPFLPAPGADDDGSGTTTILEALTVLLEKGWEPKDTAVEWHWYSAEEGGMLGSAAITKAYKEEKREVTSMCQFDMTAFVKRGTTPKVGIVTDFVSPEMSAYIRMLIDEYLAIPWVETKCGYACSDHSSWTNIGVPSAFAIEATFEDSNTQHIHTTSDRIDVSEEFSFAHMEQFVRLAIAYAVEGAGK